MYSGAAMLGKLDLYVLWLYLALIFVCLQCLPAFCVSGMRHRRAIQLIASNNEREFN